MDSARLKEMDLFSSLSEDDLESLANVAHEAGFDAGEQVVQAGTWAYQLFAIEAGTVEVQRKGETVATLEAGDVVGETGVVRRGLRNATVVATVPVRAIFFTQADIGRLSKSIPDLDQRLEAILEQRAR